VRTVEIRGTRNDVSCANRATVTILNINSIVRDDIAPSVTDAIFTDNVTYATLEANNKVVTRGGESVGWPVGFAKLNAGSYRGMTPFPSQEKQINKRAQLEWKQLFVDVVVSAYDFERATGPLAVVDIVDELRQMAILTGGDLMGQQVFGDGTGNGNLDLDGAAVAVDNGTIYPTYAGITRTTDTWWKGHVNATGGALTTSAMNASYSGTDNTGPTVGNAHPTLEVTTQNLWNKLLDRVIPSQRYEAGDERNRTARIGFDAIRHIGADVVHDSHCPSGNIWYFNVDDIELRVNGEDRMWGWTGWKTPTNQDGQQGQILFMGNLIFHSPRLHARDTGVS